MNFDHLLLHYSSLPTVSTDRMGKTSLNDDAVNNGEPHIDFVRFVLF